MRSVQMTSTVPLASVKPLEHMAAYRRYCLEAVRHAMQHGPTSRRDRSPVSAAALEPAGDVEGLRYARDPDTDSLFLQDLPAPARWAGLLKEVNGYRHSPDAFHHELALVRRDTVYRPKLSWIQETLRLQGLSRPRLLEVTTPPSELTAVLEESRCFSEVAVADEMALAHQPDGPRRQEPAQVAVLLESLDRVDEPAALVEAVRQRLDPGGLLFVTALVSSGFDVAVLGFRSAYLYPPDRTNCFSRRGLERLLQQYRFTLVETSTPGALDVEIVQAHCRQDPAIALSRFERQILDADEETRAAFQAFLQQQGLSSFTRIVARREA